MRDFLSENAAKNSLCIKDVSRHTQTDACLILQYHRVALLCHDPLQLAVEPYKFEKQMEYLADSFNVIPVSEIKRHLDSAIPFPRRTVAITFDGGYADVLYTAKEVLEKYGISATVFAASANITEGHQFWWNTLENLLVANGFQCRLELKIDGRMYNRPLTTLRDKFQAYNELYSILADKPPSEQRKIFADITRMIKLRPEELDNHRTMNAAELKELEETGLITVGGHTHNCVKLSALTGRRQVEEISKNKIVLEEVLGHTIEYFSYPFGNDNGFSAETVDILRDLGFSLACGNAYGTVSTVSQTNCYELPRVKVGNWNPFAFYRFLEGFFGQSPY